MFSKALVHQFESRVGQEGFAALIGISQIPTRNFNQHSIRELDPRPPRTGEACPTHNYEARKSRLVSKLEVFQITDAFDGVGDLHNTLHEGHFEADVLCPEEGCEGEAVCTRTGAMLLTHSPPRIILPIL